MVTNFVDPDLSDKCPRILVVDLSNNFGGASTRVLTLIKNMTCETIALAALENSPVALAAEQRGFKVFTLGKSKSSPSILFKLIKLIRQEDFQLLDTQNPQSKFWGSLSAYATGSALVSTLNSWYGAEHGVLNPRRYLYTFIELMTNFALNRYIVVSNLIYDTLLKWHIPSEKITLIYNAVELHEDDIIGEKRTLIRQFELPDDAVLIAAVGRLTWAKGYESLIRAMSILVNEYPNAYCLIAGEGELHDRLVHQITDSGLGNHVILTGPLPRENVLSLVKACDIFVMPSRTEGTPIALLEAASLKKPIVASRVGGIPELISDGVEGLLIPNADDEVALATSIKKLIVDKEFSNSLAQAAFIRIQREFSIDKQVDATKKVYYLAWIEKISRRSVVVD